MKERSGHPVSGVVGHGLRHLRTYLHMDRTSGNMADKQEAQAHLPTSLSPEHTAKVQPVPRDAGHFEFPEPVSLRLRPSEVSVRIGVQVEAREREDDVVHPVLNGDHEFGEGVESHDPLVIGRPETGEELFRDGKEGYVLDIGVVFRVIGDEVVDVVILFE